MKNKIKLLGILSVITALIIVIVQVIPMSVEPVKNKDREEVAKEEEDETVTTDPFYLADYTIGEQEDVEPEVAKSKMGLEVILLPEMEEHIPNVENMKKEIEDYLIEKDLWSSVTVAQSDFTIIEDFNKKTLQLGFELNDYKGTYLVVLINKQEGTFILNHY